MLALIGYPSTKKTLELGMCRSHLCEPTKSSSWHLFLTPTNDRSTSPIIPMKKNSHLSFWSMVQIDSWLHGYRMMRFYVFPTPWISWTFQYLALQVIHRECRRQLTMVRQVGHHHLVHSPHNCNKKRMVWLLERATSPLVMSDLLCMIFIYSYSLFCIPLLYLFSSTPFRNSCSCAIHF